jgi:hypothetical protein
METFHTSMSKEKDTDETENNLTTRKVDMDGQEI